MKPPHALVQMDKSYLKLGHWRCPGRPQGDGETDEEYAQLKQASTTAHHLLFNSDHTGICLNCGETRNAKAAVKRQEQIWLDNRDTMATASARARERHRASMRLGGQTTARKKRKETKAEQ